MSGSDARLHAAAMALRAARRGARPADLPGDLIPRTPAESYRLQDLVIGEDRVAGWKILATAAPEAFSCAAIAASDRLGDGGLLLLGDRAPEIEVEIAIGVVADLPPREVPYTAETIAPALGSAHVAFEIIESRFADRKRANPLSTLADAQSSRGFAIGAGGAEDWRDFDLAALEIRLSGDGAEPLRGRGGASPDQVVSALVWLANHAAARGPGLRAGQFVITGARMGPSPFPAAARITAEIDRIGAVSLRLG